MAKGALRRLAMAKLEPTPANYGAGAAAAQAQAWVQTIDRLAKGLERGGRHWTGARKKDSLQRVLDGSGSDSQRLQQRLKQLISAWEKDQPDEDVDVDASPDTDAPIAADAPATPAAALRGGVPAPAEVRPDAHP
ncbi:MAG: GGDEF domain-containing protein, partial [Burkholderiales bacterium PBB5]